MSLARKIVLGSFALIALSVLAALGALAFGGLEYLMPHNPRASARELIKPPLVAHRGYSAAAPENTLAAFARAAELGVSMELDVTLAATGEVVVIHDDTLERTTDGAGLVADISLEQLRTLDAGSWFDPAFAGERVPTLAEVLELVDGRAIIDVELKTTDDKRALAEAVVEQLRAGEALGWTFVSSFDPFLLEQVRLIEPAIHRAQLVGTFESSDLAWHEKRLLQNLGLNGRAQPDMVIAGDGFVTREWVERNRARGYVVMVYTINDRARADELLGWGVDAVISDEAQLFGTP